MSTITSVVYALVDPSAVEGAADSVYYVGMTENPAQRWAQHRCGSNCQHQGKVVHELLYEKLLKIRDFGLVPAMVILERTKDRSRERVWIRRLLRRGYNLLNKTHNPFYNPYSNPQFQRRVSL